MCTIIQRCVPVVVNSQACVPLHMSKKQHLPQTISRPGLSVMLHVVILELCVYGRMGGTGTGDGLSCTGHQRVDAVAFCS